MKKDDYTNREVDAMFKAILETLHRIEEQTIKHNSRMSKLEHWKEGMTGRMIGAGAVMGLVWGVVLKYIP